MATQEAASASLCSKEGMIGIKSALDSNGDLLARPGFRTIVTTDAVFSHSQRQQAKYCSNRTSPDVLIAKIVWKAK